MRQITAPMFGLFLSGATLSVIAAPTTSLPPAPPPSAFIHSINSHPASVNINKKAQNHIEQKVAKKNDRNKQVFEKGRTILKKK